MGPYGMDQDLWNAARREMREILVAYAKKRGTISYAGLITETKTQLVQNIPLQPEQLQQLEELDPHLTLRYMLGEIGHAEDAAGRGLLTAIVVHKHGEHKPGAGFFELARNRGRSTNDRDACWITELNHVYDHWDPPSP